MARKRTGTLVQKPSGWFARVWITRDGVERREFINLETQDRSIAKRKLRKIVAMLEAGELVAEARAAAVAPETLGAYAKTWIEGRKAAGIVMARDEARNLEAHVLPVVDASMPLAAFKDTHAAEVLDAARDKGLSWETVKKIRAVMRRMFDRARREKLVTVNPILDARLPDGMKKDKRERSILTDDEVTRYLGAEGLDLELKLLSLTSRTEGGMRTAELTRWDWTMLDRQGFAFCTVLRAKTGDIQRLDVPEVLRPFLRAWHARAKFPEAGPVFPVRRGPRRGESKGAKTSFAKRMRRDLFRAGIVRATPVKDAKGTLVPNPADPLYFDSKVSRRVDFHSFRRAYSTALARVGMNLQSAMALTSHSEPKTHMGYVSALESAKPIPLAALPTMSAAAVRILALPVPNGIVQYRHLAENKCARTDSNGRLSASKADALSS